MKVRHSIGAITGFVVFISLIATVARAQTTTDPTIPEVHISQSGAVTITGLKVVQRINNTFFARTTWDDTFIRWTIKTNQNSDIRKRYGDKKSVYDINEGDYLSIEGSIEGGTSLSVVAKKIVDWSDFTSQSSFSGTVSAIKSLSEFTLKRDNGGLLDVSLNATTTVYRNRREITPQYIRVNDLVTSISGLYDETNQQLMANRITISIDPKIFTWQNYQGTLKTVPTNNKPTTFTLTVGGKDYMVVLSDDAAVLNSHRQPVTFVRFLAGDTVRIYGHIREDNDALDTINADVLRNMAF